MEEYNSYSHSDFYFSNFVYLWNWFFLANIPSSFSAIFLLNGLDRTVRKIPFAKFKDNLLVHIVKKSK